MVFHDILSLFLALFLKLGDSFKSELLLFLNLFFAELFFHLHLFHDFLVSSHGRSLFGFALLFNLFKSFLVLLLLFIGEKFLLHSLLIILDLILLPFHHLLLQPPVQVLHDFIMHPLLMPFNQLVGVFVCNIDETRKWH